MNTDQGQNLRRAGVRTLLIGYVFAAVFLTPGFNTLETPQLTTLRSLVASGSLGLPRQEEVTYHAGRDGRFYSDHEIGSMIAAYPLALLAALVTGGTSDRFDRVFQLACGLVGAVVAVGVVAGMAQITDRLGVPFAIGMRRWPVFLLASQYLAYAAGLSDVALSAALAVGVVLLWLRAEGGHAGSWFWCGLLAGSLVLTKLTNATILVTLVLCAATHGRPRTSRRAIAAVVALILGALPGVILSLAWNELRTGHWLATPYPLALHGFRAERMPEGLLGSLISPNKGILVFTPVLLAAMLPGSALRRGHTLSRFYWLVLGSLALTWVRLSGAAAWTGNEGWGIRYYVPWIPLLLVPAVATNPGSAIRRRLVVAMLAIGMVGNVSGLVTNPWYRQQQCGYDAWRVPGMSLCATAALPANVARSLSADLPDVVVAGASSSNTFVSNRLALWWYAIRLVGVPPWLSWALGLSLAGASAVAIARGAARVRAEDG